MPATFSVGKLNQTVNEFTIDESCNKHDLLTIQGTGGPDLGPYAGKPAQLDITSGSNSRLIAGYLDTQATSVGRHKDLIHVGYLLGASSVMRSGAERKWVNKRPFEIARDVVQEHGFCLEMDAYPYQLSLFAQHNESDWQLLCRLADEIGMALIGTNTVIRMIDPSMEIRRRKQRPVAVYDVNKLDDYHLSASPTPVGFEARVFKGIDKWGTTFTVTANADSAITLPAPEIVKYLGDALSAKERIERRRHRLYHATASMTFNPGLRSGTTVGLTNGPKTNVWFIAEAKHTMKSDGSRTDLVLRRDADEQSAVIKTWRAVQWPQPRLIQDRWIGSQRWEREL